MKKLLLSTMLTATLAGAVPASAQFDDCQKTRLGCLDKKIPKIPIDQPVVIQVGLQVNIKCEAVADSGKNYLVDLQIVKNLKASDNVNLDDYLVPGQHGFLNFKISEVSSPGIQQHVMGESVDESEVEALENGLLIKTQYHQSTRAGSMNTLTELVFSPTVKNQDLKIFSAQQVIKYNSVFYDDLKGFTKKLIFTESNCVYY